MVVRKEKMTFFAVLLNEVELLVLFQGLIEEETFLEGERGELEKKINWAIKLLELETSL